MPAYCDVFGDVRGPLIFVGLEENTMQGIFGKEHPARKRECLSCNSRGRKVAAISLLDSVFTMHGGANKLPSTPIERARCSC